MPNEAPNLRTTCVDAGQHTEVVVEGEIDSSSAARFESDLMLAIESHHRIIVSLEHTRLITSAGLRVLLLVAKKLRERQGSIAFFDCPENVHEIFRMTGFDGILTICDSYEKAVFAVGSTLAHDTNTGPQLARSH